MWEVRPADLTSALLGAVVAAMIPHVAVLFAIGSNPERRLIVVGFTERHGPVSSEFAEAGAARPVLKAHQAATPAEVVAYWSVSYVVAIPVHDPFWSGHIDRSGDYYRFRGRAARYMICHGAYSCVVSCLVMRSVMLLRAGGSGQGQGARERHDPKYQAASLCPSFHPTYLLSFQRL